MADLTFAQGAGPVELFDSVTGNKLVPNTDGSASVRQLDSSGNAITNGQKTMANSTPVVIASDQSSVPVSVGLPTFLTSTFGYAASINQPTAGTDNPLYYIRNPNGSGKTLYLRFIAYGIAVANVSGVVKVWKNPTVSANGTAQTVVSFGGGTTVVLLTSVPTVTSNGTQLTDAVTGQNSNSTTLDINFEILIAPNNSVLITGNPLSNNRQAEISLRWIEL